MDLVIRQAWLPCGEICDVALADGVITAIAPRLPRHSRDVDARGMTLLPGLHDHHIHILATAASNDSIDLGGLTDRAAVELALKSGASLQPFGTWMRAIGLDERACGVPDCTMLDSWVRDRPLRVQDRTGALWILNTAAMRTLEHETLPPGSERDASGRPNGRFWREDPWLGAMLTRTLPDLAALGRKLARFGLTGLTDAGAHNAAPEADLLGQARCSGALLQRITMMGTAALSCPANIIMGPLKLMIDERDLPDLHVLVDLVLHARRQGRSIAAHCVTETELALYLAALDATGGARYGDRIEHGAMIAADALAEIARTPLRVVTNPGFIHDRGDRYRATIAPGDWIDLYRAASLLQASIPLAAGSDAPYASPDPWLAMRAARSRLTAAGKPLSPHERLTSLQAFSLYSDNGSTSGSSANQLTVGTAADLILCRGTYADVLADLTADRVQLTIIAGAVVFHGCQAVSADTPARPLSSATISSPTR